MYRLWLPDGPILKENNKEEWTRTSSIICEELRCTECPLNDSAPCEVSLRILPLEYEREKKNYAESPIKIEVVEE